MSDKQLLLFGFSPQESARVAELVAPFCSSLPVTIRPEQAAAKVADLVAGRAASAEPFDSPERVVLFHGFPHAEISRMIERYQALALPETIWAAVTEVSRNWSFQDLLRELQAEREQLARAQTPDADGEEEPQLG